MDLVYVEWRFGLFGPKAKYCTAMAGTPDDWAKDLPISGVDIHVSFAMN